ncbi:MAG: hypothetical protein R3B47_15670 [Bacteroidia bacterium]
MPDLRIVSAGQLLPQELPAIDQWQSPIFGRNGVTKAGCQGWWVQVRAITEPGGAIPLFTKAVERFQDSLFCLT